MPTWRTISRLQQCERFNIHVRRNLSGPPLKLKHYSCIHSRLMQNVSERWVRSLGLYLLNKHCVFIRMQPTSYNLDRV